MRVLVVFTPQGLYSTAQGRVLAHPGGDRAPFFFTPKGLDSTAQGCVLAHPGAGQDRARISTGYCLLLPRNQTP